MNTLIIESVNRLTGEVIEHGRFENLSIEDCIAIMKKLDNKLTKQHFKINYTIKGE